MMDLHTGKSISKEAHIKQSIFDILTTPKGETVLNRNYGSNAYQMLDMPINAVATALSAEVMTSLTTQEKRIKIVNVELRQQELSGIEVTVNYNGNQRVTI